MESRVMKMERTAMGDVHPSEAMLARIYVLVSSFSCPSKTRTHLVLQSQKPQTALRTLERARKVQLCQPSRRWHSTRVDCDLSVRKLCGIP